jgi:hypothetical protein
MAEPTDASALLAPECSLRRLGLGGYECLTTKVWWGQGCLLGGYVLALAMTAVEEELRASGMLLHQLSVHYLRPFSDGPLRVRVEVQRIGRRLASATLKLESGGRLGAVGLASVAAAGSGEEVRLSSPPGVAPYDPAQNDPAAPARGLQVRLWIQPRAIEEVVGAGPRLVAWVAPRTIEELDHRWLAIVTDLLIPPASRVWDTWRGFQSIDLTYHARTALPRPDLPPGSPLLVSVVSRAAAGGIVDEDVEVWDESGALLAQTRHMRMVSDPPASS